MNNQNWKSWITIHAYVSETRMLQGNSRRIIRKLQGHENESIANKLQGLIRLIYLYIMTSSITFIRSANNTCISKECFNDTLTLLNLFFLKYLLYFAFFFTFAAKCNVLFQMKKYRLHACAVQYVT